MTCFWRGGEQRQGHVAEYGNLQVWVPEWVQTLGSSCHQLGLGHRHLAGKASIIAGHAAGKEVMALTDLNFSLVEAIHRWRRTNAVKRQSVTQTGKELFEREIQGRGLSLELYHELADVIRARIKFSNLIL